jgi:hypothetical protein
MLDVPRELIRFVAGPLRPERRARGTRKGTRRLTCWKQALFAIAWFRDRPNITRHGSAFGLSQSTAYRYLHEAIDVLADRAPDLHEQAVADGLPHLEMDGKIFEGDRCREKTVSVKGETIDAWFSGKTGGLGGNVQALCEPDGFPIWFSDALPGGVVDIEAARALVLPAVYPYAKTMPVLADPGYQGAGRGIIVCSGTPPTATSCRSTTAATIASCAAAAYAGSPFSPNAGSHSNTPLSAPAESATSSTPHMSLPSSSTAGSTESHWQNLTVSETVHTHGLRHGSLSPSKSGPILRRRAHHGGTSEGATAIKQIAYGSSE